MHLEMTKASVLSNHTKCTLLAFLHHNIATHTYTQRTHTERHTQRDTHPHTMLLHVSTCVNTHAHTMPFFFAHLPVGPPASALYLSKTLVAWAVYVQGPPHLLANLLTHPTKSSYVYSQKLWDCPVPSFGIGPYLGTCETWV